MNIAETSSPQPSRLSRWVRWLLSWRTLRRGLVALAILITLVALFYTVENVRGKRAWARCKAELEAKGVVFDWNTYTPPPVPDDQNFFKAPKMQEWFVGRGSTELSRRLSLSGFGGVVAELTVVPLNAVVSAGDADMVLHYRRPVLIRASEQETATNGPGSRGTLIPLLVMNDVPLTAAITNLAQRASVNFRLDSSVSWKTRGAAEPKVSLRWTNVYAHDALLAVLDNYELFLVEDPKKGTARIMAKPHSGPRVYADAEVRDAIRGLIGTVLEQATNGLQSPNLKGTRGFTLFAKPLNAVKPARFAVRAEQTPTVDEVTGFFRGPNTGSLHVEASGSNSFRVLLLNPPASIAAVDYLSWSDSFESEFDLIRAALKRPYARMDGDYTQPFAIPIQTFSAVRDVAQTLADRAKCHLLLGQPEKALPDLTLMHDLCRLLEGRPTGKPMTLVAAMINVAVTGLYAETIADGFRLQAWREPQLAAIEEQLATVNLPAIVTEAFREARVATAHTFEHRPASEIADMFTTILGDKPSLWRRLKNPTYLFITFAPRGWVYQNMARGSVLEQKILDSLESVPGQVLPAKINDAVAEIANLQAGFRPYSYLASLALPNYRKAIQVLARNQTQAAETQVACALERYRLVHENYPETLDALAPRFIEKLPHDLIGGQPLKYRRTDDGKYLLYSIGWNEKDDGGTIALNKEHKEDLESGDWVWLSAAR